MFSGVWLYGARSVSRAKSASGAVPPTGLVLLAVVCFQLGAAIAKVLLRVGFAALILLLMWRPRLGGYAIRDYGLAVVFGLTLAGMNLAFYSALDRIPLGVAVTLEFTGPLGVAVLGSRRLLDLLWAGLAATGILLLAPVGVFGGADLDQLFITTSREGLGGDDDPLAGSLFRTIVGVAGLPVREFAG